MSGPTREQILEMRDAARVMIDTQINTIGQLSSALREREAALARYQQAEKELPEEPNYLRLRNGFTTDVYGNQEPTYGEYVTRSEYDALRAHAAKVTAERGGYAERLERLANAAAEEPDMHPLTREQIALIRKQHSIIGVTGAEINALCDMALRALPQEQIDGAGEAVAWMGKSGRVISAQMKKDCMSIPGERDFVPNCTESGMTAARKAAETYTIPLYAAPAALPDGRDEASKAISEPLSISMGQVERLGEAHHSALTILDELVCAVDGIDSLDEWDEEYGPAIARLDKAVEAARPYTEKVMLAVAPAETSLSKIIASDQMFQKLAALNEPTSAALPDGYVMVPKEPTQAMVEAFADHVLLNPNIVTSDEIKAGYKAAIAAVQGD